MRIIRLLFGALAGAVLGVVILFLVSGTVAAALGNDGGLVLGLTMVIGGGPIVAVIGAALGGWGAAAGPSSRVFKIVAGAAATLVATAVVLGVALPDNRPKPEVDVKGCTISMRTGSLSGSGDPRSVVVYDRYCRDGEGHTVNVSILPTIQDKVEGPGNALVLTDATTPEAAPAPREIEVVADFRDSLHVQIAYDYRAHVLSRTSPVHGFEILFQPDLGRPRQPDQPPTWAPPTPPTPTPASLRPARDSAAPYRPAAPGPLGHTDAEGCTIRPRLTLDQYDRHVAVYDRDCASTPHRTINVALLAPQAVLEGPGNVMVLAIDRAPDAVLTGAEVPVTVTLPDARHLEVLYDRRFHVIGHGYPGDSLRISIGPRAIGAP